LSAIRFFNSLKQCSGKLLPDKVARFPACFLVDADLCITLIQRRQSGLACQVAEHRLQVQVKIQDMEGEHPIRRDLVYDLLQVI